MDYPLLCRRAVLNDTYGVGEDMQLYSPDNITFGESAVCLNFEKRIDHRKILGPAGRNTGEKIRLFLCYD